MKTLQEHKIVHRDIKPDNILIHNGVIKLADFGFCYRVKQKEMLFDKLGSPLYMAPELLWQKPYDCRCDIYSIGCLLYELLFGNLPYIDSSIQGLMIKITQGNLRFPKNIQKISK
jgi:serine/threonine protein kinase